MTRTKYKRVPFDLELAKKITNKETKGRIVTEDNLTARIVCFDMKYGGNKILAALIDCGDYEIGVRCDLDGTCRDVRKENKFNLHIEVPTYHKDYSNFVPQKWQPCLVRENEDEIWLLQVSKGKRCDDGVLFYCPDGSPNVWRHCLPLSKATQRLIGTNKSYEELLQELDAESTATNQEPDAELTSIIQDAEFEDDKQFDFHEIEIFSDACEKLGMKEHLLTGSEGGDREAQRQAQALYKLLIIQKAMNNGAWSDKNGWSYYPYWVFYSNEEMERMSEEERQRKGIKQLLYCANKEHAGVRCAGAYARGADACTLYGFPLCFNSKEAALYAAHQFEDLFFQYYGIKVKS